MTMTVADLENRFAYHAPKNDVVVAKHSGVREHCLELAKFINEVAPESREKSLAITKLEEVMFWANAAIARNN